MGAAAGGARGGYQRRNARRRSSRGVMSDINVTPLVDVMLVLLIVFMVAAPLMTVGVPIELPKTEAKQMDSSTEPITITVQLDGTVYLQETPIGLAELTPKLVAIAKNGYEEQLFVRADTAVPYGRVMEVMGLLNSAGYRKIGLVTSTPDKTTKAESN
ncbi:MAG: biopolymer transporter ExbD [Alphaproteobacteria bacterium]|nr:biopolymer transporter ExbD [Alphaproteobacteria bacterium]